MPKLEIFLFGVPVVRLDGEQVHFESRKALALIAYLLLSTETQSREKMAALLWPESEARKARGALRYTLSIVRKALGQGLIEASGQTLAIARTAELFCDVEGFTEAAEQNDISAALDHYREGFMMDFYLPDCPDYESWQQSCRDGFETQAIRILESQVAHDKHGGDWSALLLTAERLQQLEALNEVATRGLMEAHAAQGNFGLAMRSYEQSVSHLHEELGLEPEPKTQALYDYILQQREASGPQPDRGFATMPTTTFIGREVELASLQAWLNEGERLITILAPGGMGKTRLALALAQALEKQFGSVVFVALSEVQTAENSLSAMAKALGLTLFEGTSVAKQVLAYLSERELLLVLDNVEHLTASPLMPLLGDMLTQAPRLSIVATSRQRLPLSHERPFVLGGLDWQGGNNSAEQLFIARAKRHLASVDRDLVRQICTALEGLPLAIELAAAMTATFPLSDIIHQLELGLEALESQWADLPARHRSIKTVFLQAWQGLSHAEQHTLARLTVFRGGFTMAAMREVAGATSKQVTTFIDHALVSRQGNRFSFHELLRQFAFEQLEEMAAVTDTQRQHALYYANLLTEHRDNVTLLSLESENIQAAWHYLSQHGSEESRAIFITHVWHYYRHGFRYNEAIALLSEALDRRWDGEQTSFLYAQWTSYLAEAHMRLGQIDTSLHFFAKTLTMLAYPEVHGQQSVRWQLIREFARALGLRLGLGYVLRPRLSQEALGLRALVSSQALTQQVLQQNGVLLLLYMLRSRNDAHYVEHTPVKALHHMVDQQIFHLLHLARLADRADRKMLAASRASQDLSFYPLLFAVSANLQAGRQTWAVLIEKSWQAIRVAEERGHSIFLGFLYAMLINLYFYQGSYGQVLACCQSLYQLADKTDSTFFYQWTYPLEVATYFRCQDYARGAAIIAGHSKRAESRLPGAIRAMQLAIKTEQAYQQGELTAAAQLAVETLRILAKTPAVSFALDVAYMTMTKILLIVWQQGSDHGVSKGSDRHQRVMHSLRLYRGFARTFPTARPAYRLQRGSYRALRGQPGKARRQWQQGLEIARRLAMPFEEAQLLQALAEQLADDHPEKIALVSTSEKIIEDLCLSVTSPLASDSS